MAKRTKKSRSKSGVYSSNSAKYPRHNLERSLRIANGVLDQNAGKECSEEDAAKYIGVKFNKGPFLLEVSSGKKFGLLESPSKGQLKVTELAKKILRPQSKNDKINALRTAALNAPDISDVYNHYRNENLPDTEFLNNALIDKFNIPIEKLSEFKEIFFSTLKFAELASEQDGKIRIIDVSEQVRTGNGTGSDKTETLKKLEKSVTVDSGDTCFVMMPFASPIGDYFEKIYVPAIEKAGMKPIRADDEIFKTGKIIDQIWAGINNARVLVAELTGKNPNVYYELGLAHALDKPVVLVCSNEHEVPFDLRHIRVIYYDVSDPFWGQKLVDKVAENVLSALKNPEEAVFKSALKSAA
jgi:hypothetical protein